MLITITIFSSIISTVLYLFLHKKTHINLSYLYKDNIVNIILSCIIAVILEKEFNLGALSVMSVVITIPLTCCLLTILRFYRVPLRKVRKDPNNILSPADGNIIYIKKIEAGEIPIAVKNGLNATLSEFAQTNLLNYPCWLIGINMTPFDVHKNSSPVDGTIIMNKHFNGEFRSLKDSEALQRNERNSFIIKNKNGTIGVVQTASRLVRRIVSYKAVGQDVKQGDWIGMIKFGSQVDLIIPVSCTIQVSEKQQVYTRRTTIAKWG